MWNFPMVELHSHLDGGTIQYSTAYELLRAKNLSTPGDGSYHNFLNFFDPNNPAGITFMVLYGIILKSVEGDLEAIERISYEFCERQSKNGIIYTEARYTPQYFMAKKENGTEPTHKNVTLKSVIEAVNRGLGRGQKDFNTTVRTILACRRGEPEWCQDVLELATEFKDRGVIGIDLSGNLMATDLNRFFDGTIEEPFVHIFREAAKRGIHRTVHTGSSLPVSSIKKAIDLLEVERIGPGHRAVEDEGIYQYCINKGVHFETYPKSDHLAIIERLALDGVSFSINTIDSLWLNNATLKDTYEMLLQRGMSITQLQHTNIDAMKSSFAEPTIKEEVLQKLYKAYGIPKNSTNKIPKQKAVELHLHLTGSVKHSTAYELSKKKNIELPGDGSYQAFVDSIVLKKPATLPIFLSGFGIFMPSIIGDLEAIERISYEFCQYQAEEEVIYAEARYTPHLLMPDNQTAFPNVTLKSIVEAVNKGLARGEKDFGVVVRSILTCIGTHPKWNEEILNLAVQFKDKGVVGIDIVPGLLGVPESADEVKPESPTFSKENVALFQKAAKLGIHRTVHAAEDGPASEVWKALDQMKAERIGHGYRVLGDEKIYQHCVKNKVHFECCPQSSLLTGAVSLEGEGKKEHPIVRFARDGASFSINTDNPTITNTRVRNEYELVTKWGLTSAQIQQANLNAIMNSFAEPSVKKAILEKLHAAYGRTNNALDLRSSAFGTLLMGIVLMTIFN